jgi:hypothetical protein
MWKIPGIPSPTDFMPEFDAELLIDAGLEALTDAEADVATHQHGPSAVEILREHAQHNPTWKRYFGNRRRHPFGRVRSVGARVDHRTEQSVSRRLSCFSGTVRVYPFTHQRTHLGTVYAGLRDLTEMQVWVVAFHLRACQCIG